MGTKWRNKAILMIIACFLITYGLIGIGAFIKSGDEYINGNYFQTNDYQGGLNHFTVLLNKYELIPLTIDEAISQISVSEEETEDEYEGSSRIPRQIETLKAEYKIRLEDAKEEKNEALQKEITDENESKLKNLQETMQQEKEDIHDQLLELKKEKLYAFYGEDVEEKETYNEFAEVFRYYLKDTKTGEIHTNFDVDKSFVLKEKLKEPSILHVEEYPSTQHEYYDSGRNYPIEIEGAAGKYEGVIAVNNQESASHWLIQQYDNYKLSQIIFFVHCISGIIAFITGLIFLRKMNVLHTRSTEESFVRKYYRWIPIDLCILVALVSGIIVTRMFIFHSNAYDQMYVGSLLDSFIPISISSLFTTILFGLLVVQINFLYNRMGRNNIKAELKKSIIYQVMIAVKEGYFPLKQKSKFVLFVTLIIAFFPFMYVTFWSHNMDPIGKLFILFITIPALVMIVKRAGHFNKIVQRTSELAKGNTVKDLPEKGGSTLAAFAGDINTLKHGVKTSMEKQAKSERLKTELITNVSHDLRTPLTSIISYTELLKRPDLTEEDRNNYIEIIDRKSKRLNMLMEDLFEASKMVSGNIELTKMDVDIVQLLQQALGEYEDLITKSKLTFRVNMPDEPVWVNADGQKMWRVFDNLIENILKYALENTRVFITMKTEKNEVLLTFKNITAQELGENTDELFERFKRGDASRHAEGSGLGLAIAKSVIDLHGGALDIDVDGDLFKISIRMKLIAGIVNRPQD